MGTIFRLALRNLTRQKRRNIVLAAAIAFGFLVVTVIDGLTSGMVGNLEEMITQVTGGTVLLTGLEKEAPTEPDQKTKPIKVVRDRDYIRNVVERSGIEYESLSSFTMSGGRIIFNGKKYVTMMYGRDLTDQDLLDSFQFVEGGVENLSDPLALIVSDKTAENLNVKVGDEVIYTTTTINGQNNVGDFKIAGIIKSNSIMNSMQVYANIETLNKILEIPEGGYTTFSIFLKDKNKQLEVALKLEDMIRKDGKNVSSRELAVQMNPNNVDKGIDKQFSNAEFQWEGTKYGVECLNDAVPAIETVLSVVHTVTTVILVVILLIVMVGVSNTYRMVLYERIREIGTMRALGMSGKNTGRVFTIEAIILCVIGAIAGVILATILMWIIHLIPIQDESLAFFLDNGHFSFTLSLSSIAIQYILLILLTTIAVRGSAKKASSMSPAEALRTVK